MFDDLLDAFGRNKKSSLGGGSSGGLLGKIGQLLETDGDEDQRRDGRYRDEERGHGRDDDHRRGFDFEDLGEFGDDRGRRRDDDDAFRGGERRRRDSGFDFGD